MDVLVLWQDGTKNVVYSNELKVVGKNTAITVGRQVKMFYHNRWYKGTVLDIEDQKATSIDSDSSDDIPLAKMRKTLSESTVLEEKTVSSKGSVEGGGLDIIPLSKEGADFLEISQGEIGKFLIVINSKQFPIFLNPCRLHETKQQS